MPKHPVYVPSRGRADIDMTARLLTDDSVPFWLVVEPQEYDEYVARWGEEHVLSLPWNDPGSVTPVRNWIKQHAYENGYERHWQIDDNIRRILTLKNGKPVRTDSSAALFAAEEFVERYENIALAGFRHPGFSRFDTKPFKLNQMIYCCMLVRTDLPYEYRISGCEDVDMSLQALSDGWCTVLFNVFLIDKATTMSMSGGHTDFYKSGGKLQRAKELQRLWPHIVKITERNGRPQFDVGHVWRKFDTPLQPRSTSVR